MELTKGRKQKIKSFANAYYKSHKEQLLPNPYFEKCIKEGRAEEIPFKNCRRCEYDEECRKGENIWQENTKVIDELMDKLFEILAKTSDSASQSANAEIIIAAKPKVTIIDNNPLSIASYMEDHPDVEL